jgi:hypothetical protein
MKSKAKPTKGSARTKRFDVGGTVGALAGLGTLAFLLNREKNKKKGADGAAGPSKDLLKDAIDRAPKQSDTPTADDAGRQRALNQSKDPKSNLVPEGADKDVLYESDKALVRTDDKKTIPGGGGGGANKPKPRLNTTQGSTSTTGVDAGIAAGKAAADKKAAAKAAVNKAAVDRQKFLQSRAGLSGTGITTPGDPNKKEATSKAGVVLGGSTVRSDKEKMGERAREVQRRREEEMKSRYKKGGAVKASKMGSVKTAKPSMRSASSRADGIAQRGKTRA